MGGREGGMAWHSMGWDGMECHGCFLTGRGRFWTRPERGESGGRRGGGGGGRGNRTLEEGEAKLAAYDDGGRRGWSA